MRTIRINLAQFLHALSAIIEPATPTKVLQGFETKHAEFGRRGVVRQKRNQPVVPLPKYLISLMNKLLAFNRSLPVGSPRRDAILNAVKQLNLAVDAHIALDVEKRLDEQRRLRNLRFKYFTSALESMNAGGYFDYSDVQMR